MSRQVVPFSERLGFSRLSCDFSNHPERLAAYFGTEPLRRRAERAIAGCGSRTTIIDLLTRQNQTWGAPPAVFDTIARLSADRAVAVLGGQQACLFGGPYMIILKLIGLRQAADALERELGLPVVPIFWIAADDHDFQEVSFVDLFDAAGNVQRLSLDLADPDDGRPIGARAYGNVVHTAIDRLQALLPDNDFKQAALDPISRIYQPGRNIADCFAEYLHALAGQLGIPFVNPYDRQFKEAVGPVLQGIISRHRAIKETLARTETSLKRDRYHIQVQKSPAAVHLFFHQPTRTPLHVEEDAYVAGERRFGEAALLDAIAAHPLDFSPDVLTRPLIQSFFFPVAAVVGGPAEVAYYAQLLPLYDLFDLPAPHVFARPSATIIEARFERLMMEYHIPFEAVTGDVELLINQVLKASFPQDFDDLLSRHRGSIKSGLADIRNQLTAFDRNLAGVADQTAGKIDFLLEELGKKAFAAHKKKNKTDRDRLYRLRENLFPNGAPAERSIAPVYFISRYGPTIIDFLVENVVGYETGHQLLTLSEYDG